MDTNVITDVLYGDPLWETWSDAQINRWKADLWINPIILLTRDKNRFETYFPKVPLICP